MNIHSIPRAYVSTSLFTAHIPLDLAARLTNHADDESWPPALAFDGFEANVRQIVGSLTGDDILERQGRLGQARVAELRDALRLHVVAEQTTVEAEETLDERRAAVERKRQAAAARAETRRVDATRRKELAKAEADAAAEARAEQARQVESARKKAAAKKRRDERAREISKERAVVSRAKAASSAKVAANATDKRIQATKARRRSA